MLLSCSPFSGGIVLCVSANGRPSGEALVRFTNKEQRDLALKRNGMKFGARNIEVVCNKQENVHYRHVKHRRVCERTRRQPSFTHPLTPFNKQFRVIILLIKRTVNLVRDTTRNYGKSTNTCNNQLAKEY